MFNVMLSYSLSSFVTWIWISWNYTVLELVSKRKIEEIETAAAAAQAGQSGRLSAQPGAEHSVSIETGLPEAGGQESEVEGAQDSGLWLNDNGLIVRNQISISW